MPLIDRYILRQLMAWYAAVVGIVTFLLCVETIPRLLERLRDVHERGSLVSRSLASLIPEYVAVALPLALFLGTAFTFRRLAMAGELEILAASGIRNRRLLRVPLLLGMLSCLLLVGLRGYVQPAGERELDEIGRSVRSGEFGVAFAAGVVHRLSPSTRLSFDRSDSQSGVIEGIIVESDGMTATARAATLRQAGATGILLTLSDGIVIRKAPGRAPQAFRFSLFRMPISIAGAGMVRLPPARDRLDRFSLSELLSFAPGAAETVGLTAAMAGASASARMAAAGLCVLLPLCGFALGPPPKRSRSPIGIGVGIIMIVLFWRLSGLVEDHFTATAAAGHALLVGGFALVALMLVRFQQRQGFGAVEQVLIRLVERARILVPVAASSPWRGAPGPALPAFPTGKSVHG